MKSTAGMLTKLVTIILLVEICDGLFCYQCSDTSSDDGKNKCQTYVRTMNFYRKRLLAGKSTKGYVKDCSGFAGLPDDRISCAITTVAQQGGYKSFIRGCSDGVTFFEAEYNDIFRTSIPDNQTTCHYSGRGTLACVTLCSGDFCNGPSSATNTKPLYLLLFLSVAVLLFQDNHLFKH